MDKWIIWTIRRLYALSAVFVSEFIWRQCCSVWWLWCWYCENPSSRLKRSGWKYSPSLLFTPSLPPTRPRLTQQSGKSGKENFNNASMPFYSPQYDDVFHHLMVDFLLLWFFSFCIFQRAVYDWVKIMCNWIRSLFSSQFSCSDIKLNLSLARVLA